MSKDYDFKEPVGVEEFKMQMIAHGLRCTPIDPVDAKDPENYRSSFGITKDGKNFVKAWTTVDKTQVDHLTRHGANDSTEVIKVLQMLGHDISIDMDL